MVMNMCIHNFDAPTSVLWVILFRFMTQIIPIKSTSVPGCTNKMWKSKGDEYLCKSLYCSVIYKHRTWSWSKYALRFLFNLRFWISQVEYCIKSNSRWSSRNKCQWKACQLSSDIDRDITVCILSPDSLLLISLCHKCCAAKINWMTRGTRNIDLLHHTSMMCIHLLCEVNGSLPFLFSPHKTWMELCSYNDSCNLLNYGQGNYSQGALINLAVQLTSPVQFLDIEWLLYFLHFFVFMKLEDYVSDRSVKIQTNEWTALQNICKS